MNDRITDLLHEVADDVEPGDRLDAIRSEIGVRRPGRGWWAAGGVGLVAASVVAALAMTTGAPAPTEPQPVAPPASTGADAATQAVAVYYQGDTGLGLRLYREFRRVRADDPLTAALTLVFEGTPSDPDYRTGWAPVPGTFVGAEVVDDVVRVEIGDPELLLEHDPPVAQNALAIEQVIFTAQAALQERLPVQFVHDGEPVSELFGRDASEPLPGAPQDEVLAPVSLSDPSEGRKVDNDESLTVRGTTFAPDGTVTTRIRRWEGTFVAAEKVDRVGLGNEAPVSFTATFTLGELPPGDYVVISEVTDPSGAVTTDTRRITVVD